MYNRIVKPVNYVNLIKILEKSMGNFQLKRLKLSLGR
jgi:transposase InsO family protein